jgi:hypothetical protein
MPRIARVVVPGPTYHVTQRGNRRADRLLSLIEMHWPLPDWSAWLGEDEDEQAAEAIVAIRQQTRTGRPCGPRGFIEHLESPLGRLLRPRKRGPKPKRKAEA